MAVFALVALGAFLLWMFSIAIEKAMTDLVR